MSRADAEAEAARAADAYIAARAAAADARAAYIILRAARIDAADAYIAARAAARVFGEGVRQAGEAL